LNEIIFPLVDVSVSHPLTHKHTISLSLLAFVLFKRTFRKPRGVGTYNSRVEFRWKWSRSTSKNSIKSCCSSISHSGSHAVLQIFSIKVLCLGRSLADQKSSAISLKVQREQRRASCPSWDEHKETRSCSWFKNTGVCRSKIKRALR